MSRLDPKSLISWPDTPTRAASQPVGRRARDELRAFLGLGTHHRQHISASRHRPLYLRRATAVLAILQAA